MSSATAAAAGPEARVDGQPIGDPPPPPPSRRGVLGWGLASCGLLLTGGALRASLSGASQPDLRQVVAPFPLESIPTTLGSWSVAPNGESHLDTLTQRIAGSTSNIIRTYVDEMTGTPLSVLILYGPAEPVLPHTPQICYPASGYKTQGQVVDRAVSADGRPDAVFRSARFIKPQGRYVLRQSVYHSYRLDGVWSPAITDRSLPRRWAGLFKVQIQRRISPSERVEADEPIESFLRQLLPTMERMIAAASTAPAAPTAPVATGR